MVFTEIENTSALFCIRLWDIIARLELVSVSVYEMQRICVFNPVIKKINRVSSCSYHLEELDLSSCLLTHNMLQMLWPAFRHTHNLK